MPRNDSGLLVVPGSVTGQFENLGGQVFQNGGQVDWGTGANSFGVVAFSEESMDSTDWELKAGSAGSGLGFGFGFSCAFTFSRHFRWFLTSLFFVGESKFAMKLSGNVVFVVAFIQTNF